MPISSTPLKSLDITYKDIRALRSALIDEIAEQTPHLTTDHLVLVEMRIQTLLMAGDISISDIKEEVRKNKLRVHI